MRIGTQLLQTQLPQQLPIVRMDVVLPPAKHSNMTTGSAARKTVNFKANKYISCTSARPFDLQSVQPGGFAQLASLEDSNSGRGAYISPLLAHCRRFPVGWSLIWPRFFYVCGMASSVFLRFSCGCLLYCVFSQLHYGDSTRRQPRIEYVATSKP